MTTISADMTVFVTGDDMPAVDVQLNPHRPNGIAAIEVGNARLVISDIGGDDEASVLRDVLTWIRAELTVAIDQLEGPTTGATVDRPDGADLAALIRAGQHHDLDLTDADLTDTELTGADLTDANLSGATLSGATLSGATLRYANLTGADLTGADLTDANLRYADVTGAHFTDANLTGANLRRASRGPDDPSIPGWHVQSGRLIRQAAS